MKPYFIYAFLKEGKKLYIVINTEKEEFQNENTGKGQDNYEMASF